MNFDIFNNDAFSLSQLSLAMTNLPYIPTRINSMGLFEEDSISLLTVSIESVGTTVQLVPSKARDGVPMPVTKDRRSLRAFNLVHLPQNGHVNADEVQGVREFGTEQQVRSVQSVVNGHLTKMKRNIDLTKEWQRMGAIKGQILDADGTTVLLDLFTEFGVTKNTLDFALDVDATNVKQKITDLQRLVEAELGGIPFTGLNVLCSPEFFDALVAHPSVEAAYERWQDGAYFRNQQRNLGGGGGFEFAGAYFEEYRGQIGGTRFIEAGKAHVIPVGVPDLFKTYYGPAPYIETVNTPGLPYYAKQWVNERGTGVNLEAQSNVLHLNTRPRATIELSI